MAFLDWSRDLDTGIDIIDAQHKRIVEYINELHEAQEKLDRNMVGDVIDELVDYTISHFSFEESLMEKAGYPYLDPHKRVHGLFIKKVGTFVDRFKAGEDVSEDLLKMLQRWLVNHIRNEDGDYAEIVLKSMKKLKKEQGWLARSLGKFFG